MSAGHSQIGEVAARTGLSLRTIRYYEEVGLVPPSARSTGGFRLYAEVDVARLELVKQMKPLGFSLDDMRDLLEVTDALERDPDAAGRAVLLQRLAVIHAAAEERVATLRHRLAVAETFAAGLGERLDSGTPPTRT